MSVLLALTGSVALAQPAPTEPAPAPAAAEPAPAPVEAPAVVTPPQTTIPESVPPVVAPPPAAAEPPPPPPPPPAAEKDARKSPMTMNAWGRIGFSLQGWEDPKKLNKLTSDGELDLLINAEILPMVGLTGNLVGTYGPNAMNGTIQGDAGIMDLIARLDFDDAFHVWAGRMLVPSDRTNFSGPWFIAPWYYPGFVTPHQAVPYGPRQGPFGRNDGATVWGQAAGGTFKYYAGAYDLFDSSSNPLFSGRISLSLLSPEPGYYGSSTYYGKDILGIGLGAQYKKDGSGGEDYSEINVDVLFEKNLGSSGVLDVEGAFYKYMGDEDEELDYSFFALASYLIPKKIGPGQLQPLFRYQGAKPHDADAYSLIDVQLGYVVDTYACRFALGYQHGEANDASSNNVFLGVQLQK
ncbi:MAG TPA: hypothetical protein VJV78_33340 [Polyangiales bacterium]|nr:hypothetical protein [Polyangiales bacterium]